MNNSKLVKAIVVTMFFIAVIGVCICGFGAIGNQDNIKVSVVIPVYKAEKYINECMDSIINQTLKDIEIICIDDGSPDNSGKILDEYAKKDTRIKVVHQENAGISGARNVGISLAKGEYIQFVDSDDILDLRACEVSYNKAKETGADILFYNWIKTNKKKGWNYFDKNNIFNGPVFSIIHDIVWSGIYKADFIKNNNLKFSNQLALFEDQAFNLMCTSRANKIVCITDVLYTYRVDNSNSVLNTKDFITHAYFHAKSVNCVYNDWLKQGYLENNDVKVSFLKWFCSMNYWPNNFEADKLFLKSIGKELLEDDVVNLLPKEYKDRINYMKGIVNK